MRSLIAMFLGAALACAPVAAAAPKVLVVAADINQGNDVRTRLMASNAFAAVDFFDARLGTPQLATLKMYEAVFVYATTLYQDRLTLGGLLADYVDAGGGVVQAGVAFYSNSYQLGGRWTTENYDCLTTGVLAGVGKTTTSLAAKDPNHPVAKGITSWTVGSHGQGALKQGAVSLWDYQDLTTAACRIQVKGRERIDLNLVPSSVSDSGNNDLQKLYTQAALWVSGGFSPLKGTPNPVAFPDTGTGAVSASVVVTYTNASMVQQNATAVVVAGQDRNDFVITKAPMLPLSLAPGATTTVSVAFQPTAGGSRNATLQMSVAGQMSTADVSLTGKAVGAQLLITPGMLDIGGTQIGKPIAKMFKVDNQGGGKINVLDAQITMGKADFSLSVPVMFPVALAGGSSFTGTVTYNPAMNGKAEGVLTISTNDPNTPMINVPLTGYAGPPAIGVDAGTIAFGDVNVGAVSTPNQLGVINEGFSDLKVTDVVLGGANAGDFVLDKAMVPGATLPPGGIAKCTVTFKPTVVGARSGTLTITSNAGSKVVNLFGNGTTAKMTVTPLGPLAFGNIKVKQSSMPQNVTIANSGSGKLKVLSVTFSGKDATSFVQAAGPMAPFDVAGMQSVILAIACKPGLIGALAGTVTIVADVGMAALNLSCTGVAPKAVVTPPMLDFGPVNVKSMSPPKMVTIANQGTDVLSINAVTITGMGLNSYDLTAQPNLPLLVMPGKTTVIGVTFTPFDAAVQNAFLTITTDDPLAMETRIPLTGRGLVAGYSVDVMELKFSPPSIMVGGSATKNVVISNDGDGAITISKLTIDGMSRQSFSVDRAAAFMIAMGKSETVKVTFSPQAGGMAMADLIITPAGGLESTTVALSGTAVAPSLSVIPTMVDFGPVVIGMSAAPQTVTLRNTGTGSVTIGAIAAMGDNAFVADTSATQLTLAADQTTTFQVSFAPVAEKPSQSMIGVTLKGAQKPAVTVLVVGTGVMPTVRPPRGGCSTGATSAPMPLGLVLVGLLGGFALLRHRRRHA